MRESDELERVDIGGTIVAQEESVCTKGKGRRERSWSRMFVVAVLVGVLCSTASVAVYDRFFAQKVVTANIAQFVLEQRDLYFSGKIDKEQYVTNLNRFVALVKSQPRNRVVILEDVVAANGEKLEPR
ncbi:MAG: hypothetical protein ABSC55_08655 [Syntrophorhabdales bacterium]